MPYLLYPVRTATVHSVGRDVLLLLLQLLLVQRLLVQKVSTVSRMQSQEASTVPFIIRLLVKFRTIHRTNGC